ncbi:unnamed protein product [Arctogadus glacialis]
MPLLFCPIQRRKEKGTQLAFIILHVPTSKGRNLPFDICGRDTGLRGPPAPHLPTRSELTLACPSHSRSEVTVACPSHSHSEVTVACPSPSH